MKKVILALFLSFVVWSLPAVGTAADFEASFAGQQTIDGENAIAVTFSAPLDAQQNLSSHISIRIKEGDSPDGAWVLAKDPQVVYFSQVEPDTAYVITVDKGLTSAQGQTLAEGVTYEIKTRPAEPMIMFSSRGFVLASELNRGLPVDSLNISRADIDFFRIKPHQITAFKNQFWSEEYLYYYQSGGLNKIADLVYSGRWDLDIQKDLRTQVNIPIAQIDALKTPGLYLAVLKGAGQYEYGYNTTWFTISDLGIHARVYEKEIRFFVQSLKTAAPTKGVRIEGVNKKGKHLFELTTDERGIAVAQGSFEDLALVSAAKADHMTLMPMDVPALDLSEFKTATAPFRPVDLFVYGPRDIYRPGETVDLEGLLRNQDGDMTPPLPIQAKVLQPDGRMVREFLWKPGPQNHYHHRFTLPANALTGRWKVELSHSTGKLAPYTFVVAEFLPERMKLDLAGGDEPITDPKQNLAINLKGDFLYGAPAAGIRADARVHIKPARHVFQERWPGFEFGHVADLLNTSFTTEEIRLDDQGRGSLPVATQWQQITSPHRITANVSLYDSGGRPVVRNWSWQVWPAASLVGIRCLTATDKKEPGLVPSDSIAQFEVMLADAQGQRLGGQGLQAVVIREHREYYWEFKNGEWHWGSTSNFYPVERLTLDIPQGKTATVSVPVEWGGYRLEVKNPATGLTSAFPIWAGWRPDAQGQGEMNRPDRVDLTLDKPAYKAGDTARVTVRAPEGGKGYLFVEGSHNLLTLPITVPAEGKVFDLPIDPHWQRHDLYISALVVRPGEPKTQALPKRSVGLIALPLDRDDRMLSVTIDAPQKTEPGKKMSIPVTLKTAHGEVPQSAWVTLAAVDLGILNLTGFKTPSPHDYFFQERAYSPQLTDVYQKLIEANEGGNAKQRFGGDAPVLNRGGDRPATDVRILAIQKEALAVDDRGRAVFELDLPQFDGSVRLMAVAYTDREFGSADQEMILASPLVVQAVMPRFLATGDTSQISLELHNMTADAQELTLVPESTGPVSFDATAPLTRTLARTLTLTLPPSGRQTLQLPVTAGPAPGRATLSCHITGLSVIDPDTGKKEARALDRSWFLETRPPYPAVTRIWKKTLAPGEEFSIAPADLEGLVARTVAVSAGLGSEPPINLSDHVSQLFAYPYGCLEQTLSGLFPHVLLTREQMADLGIATGSREETGRKIEIGIQRLLEKQKSSGGFALWESSGPESPWLSAYACDFFIMAHTAGFEVPVSAVKKAMKRMLTYVRQPDSIPYPGYVDRSAFRASVRAYAAFVLARVQSLTLGDARSVAAYLEKQTAKQGKSPLALVMAGVALDLAGDAHTATQAFDRAIRTSRDDDMYIGDYGSPVRDFAMAYALLATHVPAYKNRALFVHELDRALDKREWLSTQERNALVMAGAARAKSAGQPWQAELSVGAQKTQISGTTTGQALFVRGAAASGFAVTNTGQTDVFARVLLSGYPHTKPRAENHGVDITRRFLDINGQPMDLQDIREVRSGDRILVELKITPKQRMPHALAVDMIPAGVELEDPNLSGAFLIDDILVDKKPVRDWHNEVTVEHREFRDDRFAAALDLQAGQAVRIFYAVRVVSPGRFRMPAPSVEDMYRPEIRSVGRTPDWMKVVAP